MPSMERKTVGYILSWGIALAAFWLLLSGYLKPLLLAFGLFSVGASRVFTPTYGSFR